MAYIKPIPLEELPYTPVELGEMLDNDEKEREIEIEGYGKGRLVISKQNKNKPFFYADEANIPANQKAAKQLQVAETAFNAPLLLSPLLGLASGIPKIVKDRTRAQIKKARMSADESNLEGAITLQKNVDDVFNMPSQRVQQIVKIAKRNKISYKQAEEYVNLKLKGIEPTGTLNPGSGRYDPTVYIPPDERIGTQKGDPLEIDKEPLQRKTPTQVERELRINRFVNDLAFTVDRVKRDGSIVPTHISKLQPKGSGYDLLGKAKAEWNQWAKRTGFIRELSDRKMTAYVEHLVGKDKYYDVFWKLPNNERFRKGSRHGPNNVRILLDNRMKSFKDASETILKKLLPKPTKNNLLVFDYDIPRKTNESIVYNTSPKDLMLKRADGTVVGRLGDYHDVLYAPYQELKQGLSENINPTTGRPYITTTLPDGTPLPESDIKTQISIWRTNIIRDKIQFIIDEAPTLKGMTQKQKWQYQGSAIQEDMVDFLDKYKDVLKPAKRLRAKLKKEGWDRKYGGIRSEDEKVDSEFLTDYEARRRKLANRRTKSLLRSLFGGERIDE